MDLNEVAVFVRVVEEGSFTSAARALGLPKSSVSRRVARLESALGVRLLQRTTRRLSLTDAGTAYYERVSQSLATIEQANACAREMQSAPRGVVRITAPADLGVAFLAPIVTRFLRLHPNIRVEAELTQRTVDLIAEGFDLALRVGHLRDSSLVARKVASLDAVLVATPGYLKKRGTPEKVADLVQHECVLFRPQAGKATWTLKGTSGVESVVVTGSMAGDDFTYLRKAVVVGAGVGLLPLFACERDLARGKLVRVLPEFAFRAGVLHLVYPSSSYLPQRVALLRDYVLANLQTVTWAG